MERIQKEEAQEASIQLKRYFPKAGTSKFLTRMDYEHGQGVEARSKSGRRWWPLIVNGELNKNLPKGVTDYLGDEAVGVAIVSNLKNGLATFGRGLGNA